VKKALIIFLLVLTNGAAFSDDEGKLIDEIKNQHEYKYYKRMEYNIPPFADISFAILTYSQDLQSPALLAAMTENDIICTYGAFYNEPSGTYILLDINDDGTLDYKTENNYIPNWILFKADIKRTSPSEFIVNCNNLYNEFNKQEGPSSENIGNIMKNVSGKIRDKNAYNRDLYYSLLSYSFTKEPVLQFNIMLTLGRFINDRFGETTSPLFFLYMGESLLNSGNSNMALEIFNTLKSMDEKSLIADYYIAYITDKLKNTNQNINKFKAGNPDFWMLKY
jgi:hypothetical protein